MKLIISTVGFILLSVFALALSAIVEFIVPTTGAIVGIAIFLYSIVPISSQA